MIGSLEVMHKLILLFPVSLILVQLAQSTKFDLDLI